MDTHSFCILDPDPDPNCDKSWIRIRIETNADPQHWLGLGGRLFGFFPFVLSRIGESEIGSGKIIRIFVDPSSVLVKIWVSKQLQLNTYKPMNITRQRL
jgi:hypothetical protein